MASLRTERILTPGADLAHDGEMRCDACGTEVNLSAGERIGFRDCCEGCDADLHSCSNCLHHDPNAHNECRESSAEPVQIRDRANRCEWFNPGEQVGGGAGQTRAKAMSDLDSLFKK